MFAKLRRTGTLQIKKQTEQPTGNPDKAEATENIVASKPKGGPKDEHVDAKP